MTNFAYDADGNKISEANASNPDQTTYAYGDNSNFTSSSCDIDGDGKPQKIITRAYDSNGNLAMVSYDTDGDADTNYTFIYNSNDNCPKLFLSDASGIMLYTRNHQDGEVAGLWLYALFDGGQLGFQIVFNVNK